MRFSTEVLYCNENGRDGGELSFCSYSLPSHKAVLPYSAFRTGQPLPMQWKRVGMKAQLTESLFVQKAGEPDPTDRQECL